MSPFSNIWAPNRGGSTTHMPAEDLQLRPHTSRGSETTTTPTLDDGSTSSTPTLSPPAPGLLHHSPRQLNDDALSEFFGGRAHRTRAAPRAPPPPPPSTLPLSSSRRGPAPPPYSSDWEGEKLPGYAPSPDFEMETVARHMFKYGFLFPIFWAIGVYFLFAPLRVTADWQSDKTEEEKRQMLAEMRETEVKWAKRCLWALLSFLLCLVALVVAVVLSRH